ncbi:MAG: helix-turn-helix domain-containing protein [Dehalococcoidia bacterium]|jgi:excisionase family DNA binding protein
MNINYKKSMFTTRELAALLNVHINTVRRWSDQGLVKSYRMGPRGDRRFSRDDVILFLEQTSEQVSTYPKQIQNDQRSMSIN